MDDKTRRLLGRMYLTPGLPGALSGKNVFAQIAKKKGFNEKQVQNFLEGLDVYTKHGRVKKHQGDRERVITSGRPFDMWEADLMDTKSVLGGKELFALVVTDVNSKMVWAELLPTKNVEAAVAPAFRRILRRAVPKGQHVAFLRTDKGKEFDNNKMAQLYADEGIVHYRAQKAGGHGAVFAERVIQDLRNKITKYQAYDPNLTNLDKAFQGFVKTHNMTRHSAIRCAPLEADDDAKKLMAKDYKKMWRDLQQKKDPFTPADKIRQKREIARERLMHDTIGRYKKPRMLHTEVQETLPGRRYQPGDWFRMIRDKGKFEKGAKQAYTDEAFQVVGRAGTGKNPHAYAFKDEEGKKLIGRVYDWEMQAMNPPVAHPYTITKQTRVKNGQPQTRIKWTNTRKYEWVPTSSL